jgi:hypothetical protein
MAANAVGSNGPPGFKSPILRSSQTLSQNSQGRPWLTVAHDRLPIWPWPSCPLPGFRAATRSTRPRCDRSEQSISNPRSRTCRKVLSGLRDGDPLVKPLQRTKRPRPRGHVVNEQQAPAGTEHSGHFRDRLPVVRDSAQRKRADHMPELKWRKAEGTLPIPF